MFGIGHFYELALVLILALVFFGPRRLPELGASLGQCLREFRSATRELHQDLGGEVSAMRPGAADTAHNIAVMRSSALQAPTMQRSDPVEQGTEEGASA